MDYYKDYDLESRFLNNIFFKAFERANSENEHSPEIKREDLVGKNMEYVRDQFEDFLRLPFLTEENMRSTFVEFKTIVEQNVKFNGLGCVSSSIKVTFSAISFGAFLLVLTVVFLVWRPLITGLGMPRPGVILTEVFFIFYYLIKSETLSFTRRLGDVKMEPTADLFQYAYTLLESKISPPDRLN